MLRFEKDTFLYSRYLVKNMREEISNWWEQSKRDLISAENSLNSGDFYLCAFMCQQAVEKGLKALLMIKTKIRTFSTHSLVELGKKAGISEDLLKDLRKLSPEYIISRYPDLTESLPYENYDIEIAKEQLERAGRVFKWLSTQMKE